MKKHLIFLASACLFSLTPTARLTAQDAEPHHMEHKHKDTQLGLRMKEMGKAFRTLGRQINDPAMNASSLQLVATMHAAAEECLQFKPEKTADLPAADQDKFVADFHTGIKGLIADLDKLTAALKASDNNAAASLLLQIKDDQKQGHKEFRKEHPHK